MKQLFTVERVATACALWAITLGVFLLSDYHQIHWPRAYVYILALSSFVVIMPNNYFGQTVVAILGITFTFMDIRNIFSSSWFKNGDPDFVWMVYFFKGFIWLLLAYGLNMLPRGIELFTEEKENIDVASQKL